MDSTTNINELPQVTPEIMAIPSLRDQLNESQIQQLVTGIQDASFKGATRLREADIPSDPSSIVIDPEVIAKPVITPEPVVSNIVVKQSYTEYIVNTLYFGRMPLLLALLAILYQTTFFINYVKGICPGIYSDEGRLTYRGMSAYLMSIGVLYYLLSFTY